MSFLGSLISGGASIISGLIGSRSVSNTNASNERLNRLLLESQAQDRALQKEFAQHGIRWRVEDAKAAGVHPLFALGGSTATYSPSALSLHGAVPDNSLGQGLAQAGQDIGRAIDATRTERERREARAEAVNRANQLGALELERAGLENDLLRSQIAKLNHTQVGPPMPSGVLPSAMPVEVQQLDPLPGYEVKRQEIPAVQPNWPSQGAGAFPELNWMRTPTGYQPVPHPQALEDPDISNPSAWPWFFRNQMLPSLGLGGSPPPDRFLPGGAVGWSWSTLNQEWRPVFSKPSWWERTFFVPRQNRR